MSKNIPADTDLRGWPVEMLRNAKPDEAERLSGVSWDTMTRLHGDKVVHLSGRLRGMRVGHCLMLTAQ